MKPSHAVRLSVITALWLSTQLAQANQVEPLGSALKALMGANAKPFKKTVAGKEVFFTKEGNGGVAVFFENGTYPPNCTHKWAVGIDRAKGTVVGVRLLEASCHHALPCKAASFTDQYVGKGPADVAKLDTQITVVAKATGTSNLTTDAVKRVIQAYPAVKGKL